MKIVLANNQSEKFVNFHKEIQTEKEIYDYVGYDELLFIFDNENKKYPISFINMKNSKKSYEYEGAYITGYLKCIDMAVATSAVFDNNQVPYVDKEVGSGISLSKVSMYARLAGGGSSIPKTYAGMKEAILNGIDKHVEINYPAILKRADADRGIDNFKVKTKEEVKEILGDVEEKSMWILQDFIPNDGFYLVGVYNDQAKFAIFRTLEERPDKDERKAHMYKPKGGINASLIELTDINESIINESVRAAVIMNRQICAVDLLFDPNSGKVYILEVNYNPQIASATKFKEIRHDAFLDVVKNIGNPAGGEL